MSYKVFNFDDPNTWPKLNCPLLVFLKNDDWPLILQWDNEIHCFVDNHRSYYPIQCFYKYVGYMPYIEKELHPTKCMNTDRCYDEDDGYCLHKGGCEYQKEVTEYLLGSKPIWKEY
jgi:hypothetical protein